MEVRDPSAANSRSEGRIAVGSANRRRLVSAEMMQTGHNLLCETIGSSTYDDDGFDCLLVGYGMCSWRAHV